MSYQKPLVLETPLGQTQLVLQRLQVGNDLDIPLQGRVDNLEHKLNSLITWLLLQGFELPEELIN